MLTTIFTLIIGAIIGFFAHAIAMKINYKQRAIEDKKQLYLSIVRQWLKMRNFVYDNFPNPHANPKFDRLFAEATAIAGGILLVSEENDLSTRIETLNNRFYRTAWSGLTNEKRDEMMNKFKDDAWEIIKLLRSDIRDTSRLELADLLHIFYGLFRLKK